MAIFSATDPFGEKVVLTEKDWNRIKQKRPGVDGYQDHVQQTIETPTAVYEGRYDDSKVFYKLGLLEEDRLYKGCYVAVVVRYLKGLDGSVRTVYFPYEMRAALGQVLHL